MAESLPICAICDLRHIFKNSSVWCQECDESLCEECQDHHGLSNSSRHHKVIPVEKYLKLPSDVLNIKEYCNEHEEKFILFCQTHNSPCCKVCVVVEHSDCKDKVLLEDVIQNVKVSSSFEETEHLIEDILEYVDDIYKEREYNAMTFQQLKKNIEQSIGETRAKINSHLDKIEQNLYKELAESEAKLVGNENEFMKSLEKHKNELTKHQTTLTNLKKYSSDLQAFCGLKQVQAEASKHEQYIHSIVKKGNLDKNSIVFKINPKLEDVIDSVKQFGEVNIVSISSQKKLIKRKDKQAQLVLAPLPIKSIDICRVVLLQKIESKLTNICGCTFLPDDNFALSSFGCKLLQIFSKDGLELSHIKTSRIPYDIAYIAESNSIAVTDVDYFSQCITMICYDSQQIIDNIPVNSPISGIAVMKDALYVCAGYKGLQMVHLADNSIHDVCQCKMSGDAYIASFKDKLYYTNQDKHTVTCCNLKGQTQWEFKDEELLSFPCGIDLDNNGYIYVAGYESNNVVVISPNGMYCLTLLSEQDGLRKPEALQYNKYKRQLLVANEGGTAFLYMST